MKNYSKDIENLLINKKYSEAIDKCKKLLQANPNDPELWYYLFLSENDNYIGINGKFKDEMSFNKACELFDDKRKEEITKEYYLYKILSQSKYLPELFRYSQLKRFDKLFDEIYKSDSHSAIFKNCNLEELFNYIYNICDTDNKVHLIINIPF